MQERKEERERSRPRQPEEGAEKSVDVTVPQNLEELEATAQIMPQERAQYRTPMPTRIVELTQMVEDMLALCAVVKDQKECDECR